MKSMWSVEILVSVERLTIGILEHHLEPFRLASFFTLTKAGLINATAHDLDDIRVQTQGAITTSDRSHRWLRWVGNSVIHLITAISHISKDGVGLLDQIDLETDMVDDIGTLPWYRHNGDQIDKWNATLAVIDQGRLAFFSGIEHALQVCHSDIVGVLSFSPLDDFCVGC
jgi:hypothetical protein